MTGYGAARTETDELGVSVELRSVNNRYLKISVRCPDTYSSLEGQIEKLIKTQVNRGTVQVHIRVDRTKDASQYRIHQDVIDAYVAQLAETRKTLGQTEQVALTLGLAELIQLPGVVTDKAEVVADLEKDWPVISNTIDQALARLMEFRVTEGASTEAELRAQKTLISSELDNVSKQAPTVVSEYRNKMLNRVRELLAENDAKLEESDLIREVSIFADRCDINEEITRLQAHLVQFDAFMDQKKSQGRKLDFLGQEMFREVNTIGSKANHVGIAHCVVEMKSAIEKIREIVQNVE